MRYAKLTKNGLLGLALTCASFISFANDAQTPEASAEKIATLTAACQQIAEEEEIEDSEMSRFVFDCLNDQLNEMGYNRVLGGNR